MSSYLASDWTNGRVRKVYDRQRIGFCITTRIGRHIREPQNLTNYSAAAKLKRNYNSDSADTTNFAAAITTPPTDGILTLSLTNAQTDALKVGNYVYDAEISFVDSNGSTVVERILEGKMRVSPSVTR